VADVEAGEAKAVLHAFDGSTATFKALRAFGWGPLLNLGHYSLPSLLRLPFGTGYYQRRLARRSIALLDARPGDLVIDAGCGRGWTAAEIARSGASVIGLDLLREHVEHARREFANRPGLRFAEGDATRLLEALPDVTPGSVARIHCLEVGFHFGAAGRRAFLAQAFAALRPGGRLVLVDFVWRDDRPEEICALDPERLVRGSWGFEEFEPAERYRAIAAAAGFRERAVFDWTRAVVDRFQRVAQSFVAVLQLRAARRVVALLRPRVRDLSEGEWRRLRAVMQAHDRVRRRAGYYVFVLEKPGA
jgi:SAM-dependent methyltransferase